MSDRYTKDDPYLPKDFDEAELIGWDGFELSCGRCRSITWRSFSDLRRATPRRRILDVASRLVCRSHGIAPTYVALHRGLKNKSGVAAGSVTIPLAQEPYVLEVCIHGPCMPGYFDELVEQLQRGMRYRSD